MRYQAIAVRLLRAVGGLLIVLGLVHLAATPFILRLLDGSPPEVYEFAVGPTLLNHILFGILLLPLGYSTWLAAKAATSGEVWAKRTLTVNTIAVLMMPVLLVVLMRRPGYYTAPLFVTAVSLVGIIALLMAAATFLLVKTKG
jgi:hypothetical protein